MLRLRHVSKSFGATRAVDDVSLTIDGGEIVGLLGENGAGKTTLMRIAAGELRQDAGDVISSRDDDEGSPSRRSGRIPPFRPDPSTHARDDTGRVAIVHQHFALIPQFTIAENLALSRDRDLCFISRGTMIAAAERTIAASGIVLADPNRRVADLAVGEKAKLELIKAVAAHPSLIILDEPTSVLTPVESEELFALIRRLAAQGTAIVFITHKVPEALAITQRIVVMRRGQIVWDVSSAALTASDIATAMVGKIEPGRVMSQSRRPSNVELSPVLTVRNLSGGILSDVSFTIGRGECVAIVGVAGNGQRDLASILRGLEKPRSGAIDIATKRVAFIPEDRTRDALVPEMTIAENIALTAPRWRPREAAARAAGLIELYSIRARGPKQRAGELSGGNQQKVVLARELGQEPELIVAAEPSRGLDFQATHFVHEQLRAARNRGAGVLLITSDLDEAFALADTMHVMYRGRLSEGLDPLDATSRVAGLMAGIA